MTVDRDNERSRDRYGAGEEQTEPKERYHEEDFREETAAEVIPRPYVVTNDDERQIPDVNMEDEATTGRGVGVFALVLSILSLFFLPIILGAAGIIVGFVARRNGATGLGNWAIGLGALSIILTVFFSPFF